MHVIEQSAIKFLPHHLGTSNGVHFLEVTSLSKKFPLTELQKQYFEFLNSGQSIEALVQFYLSQGWLVSFTELFKLIETLSIEGVLVNWGFKDYFLNLHPKTDESLTDNVVHFFENVLSKLTDKEKKFTREDLGRLPFFKNLKPELLDLFYSQSELVPVNANVRICTFGKKSRDLYVLVKGEAWVFKPLADGQRQFVVKLKENAVFGEAGFLLGTPRSAEIISKTECEILKIKFIPEFDEIIKKDVAQALHQRFWIFHALSSSKLFSEFPMEVWDDLVFSGVIREYQPGEALFHQGQPAQGFYLLLQGQMDFLQNQKLIKPLQQGECIGEVALLVSGGQRTGTVMARTPSLVLEISAQKFYSILGRNLFLAYELERLAQKRVHDDQTRLAK